MLNIHFLGKARMTYEGNPVYEQLGAKSHALISLLILNENRYMSRDKIIGYLWPDSNDDAARYNLRYNLWLIKKTIQPDAAGNNFLQIDKETCGINEAYAFKSDVCDVIDFSPSDEDTVASRLALKEKFVGDFLEGCYFNKCDAFNDLIIFERINFEKRKVKIMKRLADLYESENRYDECIETIHEILEIEPYDETFVSKILDVYMLSGKRASAINYYNKFSNQLAGSLGIVPTKELRDKFNELRSKMGQEQKEKPQVQSNEKPSKESNESDQVLEVNIVGSNNIAYSGLSELAEALFDYLLSQEEVESLSDLSFMEYQCLAGILPRVITYYQRSQGQSSIDDGLPIEESLAAVVGVKDIVIINSLKHLIKVVCLKVNVSMVIQDETRLDPLSLEVIQYFEALSMKGVRVLR